MKVALVLDYFDPNRGGVEKWTAQLVDELLRLQYTVHIVAAGVNADAIPDGVIPHCVGKQRNRIGQANAMAALLKTLDVDVIHDMGCGWYCDVLQPHGGSRTASFEHNLLMLPALLRPFKRVSSRFLPRYREFQQLLVQQYRSDGPLVMALSKMVRQHLKQYHRVPDRRIRMIYNGVDISRFSLERCSELRQPMRAQLGLADQPLLLIVAHNHRLKGVATLLRASADLLKRGHQLHVAVVGGKPRGRMHRLAQKLEIQQSVHFAGAIEDPIGYYSAADLYVQPTFYDPCSLVVLEALACGLPVITSRYNGAGELITPRREGILIDDPGDHDVLSIAIGQLLDKERRTHMAIRARQLAEQHTLSHNVAEVLNVYSEVVQCKNQSSVQSRAAA